MRKARKRNLKNFDPRIGGSFGRGHTYWRDLNSTISKPLYWTPNSGDFSTMSPMQIQLFQALQSELRSSEAKGSGLERQVSQLSARMSKVGSGGSSGRSGGSGGGGVDGGSGCVYGVGDGTRGPEVAEAEIAALRRQMTAATQVEEN